MATYSNSTKKQKGVGLIEALIAALMVAVGLMALTAMQGGLMHSSGENKTRSEAVKLAESKLEELRNNISKANYDDIASSAADESINGSNSTFTRSWTVTDAVNPERKNVNVQVSWGNGADEIVNMVSEVSWGNPGKATDYATDGNGLAGKSPSPNNNSSSAAGTQFNLDEINGETPLNDGSSLLKYTDAGGYIYLLDSSGNALIRFNGGIIHTIKGNVWEGVVGNGRNPSISLRALTDYPVTFSDLAYCVFPVTQGESDYICYFGGDCTNGGSGCVNQNNSVSYEAVDGGWYGKVGLIESGSSSFHNKKVCFAEDIAGSGVETATTTARLYSTRRLDASNNVDTTEGINQSFACQDFLVVDQTGNSNDCHYFADNGSLSVPSSSVYRSIGPNDDNTPLSENVSSCGSVTTYSISGSISGDQASQVQVFVNGNGCTSTSSSGVYSYQCSVTVENTATSLELTALNGDVTPSSTSISVSTSQTNITGPTLVANSSVVTDTEYHITGTITGNQAGSVTLSLTGGSCSTSLNADSSYSYECIITSTPTTVTLNASGGNVQLATGSSASVSLGDSATVIGPNYIAATAVSMTYNISGSITGTNHNSVNLTLSGGSCTNNNDNTYTCTITTTSGDVTINASGGNVSPLSATLTLAGISPVTGPTFASGNDPSCSVTIIGNISKGVASGSKNVTHSQVVVTATVTGSATAITCNKTSSSSAYSYSCSVGTVNDANTVTIGGSKVSVISGTNPLTVNCTSDPISIIGPSLVTTN